MLNILASLYGKAVNYRNKKFDSGSYPVVRTGVPVISIGNISAGGTGKTPFVRMLADELIKRHYKPAIIGRGYKRKSKGEIIVSDGVNILADSEQSGDEMLLLASLVKCPVIVHDRKYLAAQIAAKKFDIDVIIVDDGFQHRKLYRDMDIVLVDKNTVLKPFIIPKGRLREPLSSLKRADIICLTSKDIPADGICELINNNYQFRKHQISSQSENTGPEQRIVSNQLKDPKVNSKIFYILTKPGIPYNIFSGAEFDISSGIAGIAVSGIANPSRFFGTLVETGIIITGNLFFNDHHNYSENDISKIISACRNAGTNIIFTTEKDKVKLLVFKEIFEKYKIICNALPIFSDIEYNKDEFFKIVEETLIKNKARTR